MTNVSSNQIADDFGEISIQLQNKDIHLPDISLISLCPLSFFSKNFKSRLFACLISTWFPFLLSHLSTKTLNQGYSLAWYQLYSPFTSFVFRQWLHWWKMWKDGKTYRIENNDVLPGKLCHVKTSKEIWSCLLM